MSAESCFAVERGMRRRVRRGGAVPGPRRAPLSAALTWLNRFEVEAGRENGDDG